MRGLGSCSGFEGVQEVIVEGLKLMLRVWGCAVGLHVVFISQLPKEQQHSWVHMYVRHMTRLVTPEALTLTLIPDPWPWPYRLPLHLALPLPLPLTLIADP